MARKPRNSKSAQAASAAVDSAALAERGSQSECLSSSGKLLATAMILTHFTALLLTLSANLAPSYLQGRLTAWFSSYLVTTNQDYTALPLELTHADAIDFPLVLEVHRTGDEPQSWREVKLPHARWQNFSRWIRLISVDQPESELLADVLAHFAGVIEERQSKELDAIRLVAPKVLSYDEDALVAGGEPASESFEQEIAYKAHIIRDPLTHQIQLVPAQDPLRTSKPVHSERPQL